MLEDKYFSGDENATLFFYFVTVFKRRLVIVRARFTYICAPTCVSSVVK